MEKDPVKAGPVIVAGVTILGGAAVVGMYHLLATGDSSFDDLRLPVIWAVATVFPKAPTLARMRALMLIAQTENSVGKVGDKSAATGPSIGPWQVSRGTAIDLGIYTSSDGSPANAGSGPDRAAYEALKDQSNFKHAHAAAVVFKSKLAAADGDINDAIRRYNGSGPSADTYEANAVATAASLGWKEFTA